MITDYFVCCGDSTENLRENVMKAIANGWQPFGGVSVAMELNWVEGAEGYVPELLIEVYCQAVIKES